MGLSSSHIVNACLNARCVSDAGGAEIAPCKTCTKNAKTRMPVLAIGCSDVGSVGPYVDGDCVMFVFNRCRSNCSSSRDHIRSRVSVAIGLTEDVIVISEPLTLLSRVSMTAAEKRSLNASVPLQQCASDPGFTQLSDPMSVDDQTPFDGQTMSLDVSGTARGSLLGPLPCASASPVLESYPPPSSLSPELRAKVISPTSVFVANRAYVASPERPLVLETHVVVAISQTNLSQAGAEILQQHFVQMLGAIPDFIDHKFHWSPGMLVGMGHWRSPQAAYKALPIVDQYTKGDNPWGQDLEKMGAILLLSLCTSF